MKDILRSFVISLFVVSLALIGLSLLAHSKQKLVSPISKITKIDLSENLWFPKDPSQFDVLGVESQLKNITAEAAFFVDPQSGEVLFEKNSNKKLHIASLIKIMTAIITLENRSLNDELEVSKRASGMEPDKMFLIPGEKLSVEELLSGIFLVSANDAAEVLAEQSLNKEGFSLGENERKSKREEFIDLMNVKARQLGMNDTFFANPTGLDEDNAEQYSTAYDVALMSRYAMRKWPKLIEISSNPHIFIPKTEKHQDYDLYSGINLLTTYPGVVGFKTGYTPEAGLTLTTIARKGEKEVLGVLLNAVNRRDDAKIILDYSFEKMGVK